MITRALLAHKVDATCITLATLAAIAGAMKLAPDWFPLERAGEVADIGAGSFALYHWRRRKHH